MEYQACCLCKESKLCWDTAKCTLFGGFVKLKKIEGWLCEECFKNIKVKENK